MAVHAERRTIEVILDDERHGSPVSQFTLWFGANLQITAIVAGALAVVFGADPLPVMYALLEAGIVGVEAGVWSAENAERLVEKGRPTGPCCARRSR